MTTIKDVAEAAGVSPATVSRALGRYGYVKESTRQHVVQVARRLGYRPNALARSMITRSTQTIGLIISDIANPFFPEVVRGIEDAAHEEGYNVILCNSDEDSTKEKTYIDVLLSKRVDGLIVATSAENVGHLVELKNDFPVVLLDRIPDGGGFDAVKVDNTAGAFKAVQYLIELGHERIGIVTGPEHIATARERFKGYKNALSGHGIAVDPHLIYVGDFKEEGGHKGVQQFMSLDAPPTALFTTNNRTTAGALSAAKQLGVRIPEQLSIVAFDDVPWMELMEPRISVVRQPTYALGIKAAELLFERLAGSEPDQTMMIQLGSSLILRESCMPPQEAAKRPATPGGKG